MVILKGIWASYCVPDLLYHGTFSEAAERILEAGLQHDLGEPQSVASRGANYLTTSLGMAASIARSRAFRCGGLPRIIVVDARQLNADSLSFDLNMCGAHWSESVAYAEKISQEALCLSEIDAALVPDERMLLDEPEPGERPLVFKLDWVRAAEFVGELDYDRVVSAGKTGRSAAVDGEHPEFKEQKQNG